MGGEGNVKSPQGLLNLSVFVTTVYVSPVLQAADSRPKMERRIFCAPEKYLLFQGSTCFGSITRFSLHINVR